MDWDKLRIFAAVADAGSFTHAGETLRLSQSAVSRQISALEESLGTTLFHRHARGLVLTEQGELLHRTVRDIATKLSSAEARLNESRERPSGPLRITTSVGLGSTWLTPRMREFIELYPDIEVSLIVADEELDLTMREADVAIRMGAPRQPDLIQRKLMTVHFHVYAAPSYLERHGIPRSVDDLEQHRILVFGDNPRPPFQGVNWLLTAGMANGQERRAAFRVNSAYGIYRAVQAGMGIASLPDYLVSEESKLVRVLPELSAFSLDTYFVYPEALRNSTRVEVFRDFLISKIAQSRF